MKINIKTFESEGTFETEYDQLIVRKQKLFSAEVLNAEQLPKRIIPKIKIAQLYQIDKKTLAKWVYFFGQKSFPNFIQYQQRKKLSVAESVELTNEFGLPHQFPVLTKKGIIELGEGTYSSLRSSVKQFPNLFGITIKAFTSLHKFPPKIGQKIIEQYG